MTYPFFGRQPPLKKRIAIYAALIVFVVGGFALFTLTGAPVPRTGQSVSYNAMSLEELKSAANPGEAEAQYQLGWKYGQGEGIAQDYKQAADWYQKAADQGHAHAINNLGGLYEQGFGVAKDYAKARDLYMKAADLGNAGGQMNIGRTYELGIGAPVDPAKALEWYMKAAENGSPEAQHYIAYAYATGSKGLQKDLALARKWYERSADAGYAPAQQNLGNMYRLGLGVDTDLIKSGTLYKRAADNGLTEAEEYIKEVRRDCSKNVREDGNVIYSLKSCFFAAATDDPKAMHAVGLAYLAGEGVEVDKNLAFEWLLKAAKAGSSGAQVHLGVMYDTGDGISIDYMESYAWFFAAGKNKDLNAMQKKVVEIGKATTLEKLDVPKRHKAEQKAHEYAGLYVKSK